MLLAPGAPAPAGRAPLLSPITGDLPRRLLVNAAYAVVYLASVYVARLLRVNATGVAATWPVTGVGAIWIFQYVRRSLWWRRLDTWLVIASMAVLITIGNATTGWTVGVLFYPAGLSNASASVIAAALYVHWGRQGAHLPELASGRDVRRLVVAAVVGVAVSWLLMPLPAVLAGAMSPLSSAFWAVRNLLSLLYGLFAAVLLFGRRVPIPHGERWWVVAAVTTGFLVFMTVFAFAQARSVFGYVVLILGVGAAAVFSLGQTFVFQLAVGVLTTAMVVTGFDPFGAGAPEVSAALVHFVLSVVLVVAMTTAGDRAGRVLLLDEVQREREAIDAAARLAADHAAVLRAVLTSMSDGVLILDADGGVVLHNDAAAALVPVAAGARPAFADVDLRTAALRSLEGGVDVDVTLPGTPDRPEQIVAVRASRLDAHQPGELAVVLRVVTDDRRQVDELRRFGAVVAHDLRQPMSAIELWSELLVGDVEGEALEPTVEAVTHIRDGVARLDSFLADLSTYTLARDGRLDRSCLSVADLAADVVETRRRLGQVPDGAEVRVDADVQAYADRALLRQALDNLVGNAVKYARPGEAPVVHIGAERDEGETVIRVDDAGVGIPARERAAVFDEFYRAQGHRSDYPGTGLGLAIVRRVATRHGGSVVATASPMGGTRIELRLPPSDACSSC